MALAQTQTVALTSGNIFAPKASPAPPTALPPRARPYKDFLTPNLHRRFVRAALLVLGVCYLSSLLLHPPRWLWVWNPISFTGARALLLFIPCLAIFIVRLANMHVGPITTSSPAETLYQALIGRNKGETLHTVVWYVFSACFFGEVYLWSRTESANLGWVDHGRPYERPRMNENPIFLRSLWFCLGIAQAAVHLARDEDQVFVPEKKEDEQAQHKPPSSRVPRSLQELYDRAPTILGRAVQLTMPVFAFTLLSYFLLLRWILWPYFYSVGTTFFSNLPPTARPTGLQHLALLAWQCFSSSCLLIILWELSSAVFTIFVSRPPLKREQPLTNEIKDGHGEIISRSRDPNGSLINGLRSKKAVPNSFAFWELWLICSQYDDRRKTIYTEIDHPNGSVWKQISDCCLDEIESVRTRIINSQEPPPPPPQEKPTPQEQAALGLPRISDVPVVENGNIYTKPSSTSFASNLARSAGAHPNAIAPRAKQALDWSAKSIPSSTQALLKPGNLQKDASTFLTRFLHSPVGEPFRQTFARTATATVLGTRHGHSRRITLVHASMSLSILCSRALKEDDFGQVAASIPEILRTYTIVIEDITAFLALSQPKWTDVEFKDSDRRVREVEEVVSVLKAGLEGVLLAFGEYAGSIGVPAKELTEARRALGKGAEMQVRR